MPIYDYRCTQCGDFTAMRPMSRSSEPSDCPACGSASPRVLVAGSAPELLDGALRRSRENGVLGAQASAIASRVARHSSGCGCCSPAPRRSLDSRNRWRSG